MLGYNEEAMKISIKTIRSIFDKHPELWFFIFANTVFAAMYFWSFTLNPSLFSPGKFIIYTLLTLFHMALHWSLLVIGEEEKWFWPYVIIQGLLAFSITAISQNLGMIFALYMALIGEIIGSGQRKLRIFFAVIFYIILSLINYIIINGIEESGWWLLGTLPLIFFVIMYVSLYTRASNDRDRARKLLDELEITHQQLSEYANQVEELTLTTERQRMARELHDTLAQGLAGLILQLEAADSHLNNQNTQKAQTIIQQAMTRARTTLADARQAIGDLRDDTSPTDLNQAIQNEFERFQHTTGIPGTLDLCLPSVISSQTAENVLRTISEGLTNIARHAEATEAKITMSCDDENLWIEIRDDGIGFTPDDNIGRSGHYGLLGMRERTRILGGSLTIESQSNQGTTIKIQLPLINGRLKNDD
jgi:NarL family two-component system sensor histidine kinase YdfH